MAGGDGMDVLESVAVGGDFLGWKNRGIFNTIFQRVRGEKIEIVKVGSRLWKQRMLEVWKGCYYVFDLLCYDYYVSTKKNPRWKREFSSSAMSKDLKSNHDHPWSTGHHPHGCQWLIQRVRPCMTSTPTPTSFQRAFSKDLYGPIPRCLGGDSQKLVHEKSQLLGKDSKKIKTIKTTLVYFFVYFLHPRK